MGKKFIIEIEDRPEKDIYGMNYYKSKKLPLFGFTNKMLSRLTPYEDHADEAEKAWALARWVLSEADNDTREETFPHEWNIGGFRAIMSLSYDEARERYEAWQKKEAEIKVGDEVIACSACSMPFVVLSVNNIGIYGTDANGSYRGCNYTESRFEKTGRHFPEAAELMKKIGGKEE